jgi:hypothetical protein
MMTNETHTHVEGNARTDPRGRFKEIREGVEQAQSKEELTELYKRTVYMILMTHSSPIDEKFDREMRRKREAAEREFSRTVRVINRKAKKIGVEDDYDENWKNLATNGYETEGENILEAQAEIGIVKE